MKSPAPPKWAVRLLRAALPDEPASATIIGDLIEELARDSNRTSRGAARRRFGRRAASVSLFALRDRALGRFSTADHRQFSRSGDGMMGTWVRDLRVAARSLSKAPEFALVATLTLAIGIGANTAIFSAVNGVLLEPLGFDAPEELVSVLHTAPGFGFDRIPLSPDTYALIENENRVFAAIAAVQTGSRLNLTSDAEPRMLTGTQVSANLPGVLGMTFPLGRGFLEEEDRPGGPDVAVIGHALWQTDFGGDPAMVGRTIVLDGTATEVVGVLPERIDLPSLDVDVWLPIRIDAEAPTVGVFSVDGIARLQPGRAPEVAEANLAPLIDRLVENNRDAQNYLAFIRNGKLATVVTPLKQQVVGDLQRPLWILLGTVAFVLLIACANVANLVLVRSESRQKEIAVRAALGAGRGTVMRYFVAESVILAAAGGVLGVLVATAGLPALLSLTPENLPRAHNVGIDGAVLAFTGALIGASILLFGVVPAARTFSPGMFGALKHARGSTEGREGHRLRNMLVAGQTALAIMLLVGSGLLLRSYGELRNVDPGFDAEGVLTFSVSLPDASFETQREAADFHQRMLDRLEALPGVVRAGASDYVPMSGGGSGGAHTAEDVPVDPGELPPVIFFKTVTPGYFEAMGTALVAGRLPERADHEEQLSNVVIDQTTANRMWPGQSALGKRVGMRSGDTVPVWYTVVGVIETVRDENLTDDPRPLIYYPMVSPSGNSIAGARTMTYVVRTDGDPTALAGSVRAAVWEANRDLPIADMREMSAIVADSTARMSFTMIALGVAALVALLLGAIGLYGVLSYVVAQRTREIGVRIALGAEARAVRGMVVRQGMFVAGTGLLVGLAGAFALARVLGSLLYGTSPNDPLTYVATSAVLLGVGALASYLPARRASAIDPMQAVRAE